MPITDSAIAVYYWSPFDPLLLLCLLSFSAFVFLGWFRPSEILKRSRLFFWFYMLVWFGGISVVLFLLIGRAISPQGPRLVIHPDYVACGSWTDTGKYMRIPWHHVTSVSRQLGGEYYLNMMARFDLEKSRLSEVPWNSHVKSNGWVYCQIDGLTNDPRSWRLPTNTEKIYADIETTWKHGNSQRLQCSYRELMERVCPAESP